MGSSAGNEQQPNRRERLRQELTGEIVAIGRRQLAEGGPSAVSWRGIAKEVGMNPASLYTYVDGIDDLFTRILLDSFGDLAAHVAAAAEVDGPIADRLLATCLAYREWAVANPQRFNLIFTDQIPGYAAPPGGPTVEAEMAVGAPFLRLVGELQGRATPLDVAAFMELPVAERSRLFAPFAALHGFVSLEINNHAPFGDNAEMLRLHLLSLLDSLRPAGLDRAPTDGGAARDTVDSGTADHEHEEHGR